MSGASQADRRSAETSAEAIGARVEGYDWTAASQQLDAFGWAMLPALATAGECAAIGGLYDQERRFRSRIVMARHGFGRGEYQYFAYPLPGAIAALRGALYGRLAPIANRWNASMRIDVRYPAAHADFIARCHVAGQTRPTPLLLQYGEATSTRCTRTSRARRSFRCRWPCCCPSRSVISPVASTYATESAVCERAAAARLA